MGMDIDAKVFYGYALANNLFDWVDKWPDFFKKIYEERHDVVTGWGGYDGAEDPYLAIKETLHSGDLNAPTRLIPLIFGSLQLSSWNERLAAAAQEFDFDLTGLTPGWFLVVRYW